MLDRSASVVCEIVKRRATLIISIVYSGTSGQTHSGRASRKEREGGGEREREIGYVQKRRGDDSAAQSKEDERGCCAGEREKSYLSR